MDDDTQIELLQALHSTIDDLTLQEMAQILKDATDPDYRCPQ
jgi:hypothetical protein